MIRETAEIKKSNTVEEKPQPESIYFKEECGLKLRLSAIEQKQREINERLNIDMILEEQSINERSEEPSNSTSPDRKLKTISNAQKTLSDHNEEIEATTIIQKFDKF